MSGIDCEDHQAFRRRNGGARRDRTDDLKLAKLALSQLSYGPVELERTGVAAGIGTDVVGPGRFELPTPRLSSVCSNQLSYGPSPAAACRYWARNHLSLPCRPRTGLLQGIARRREVHGRETRTAVNRHLFCCDVHPDPKIRLDSPAAREFSKSSETGHSRTSLERR
jgi:hypothetical protein